MKTRIITYIFLILGLAACSDEFDMPVFEGIGEDGSIELTLSVPELQKIATRSGEDEVGKVAVLVFECDEDTAVAKQIETFSTLDGTLSSDLKIRFILDKDLRSKSNLNLYFVANYNGELVKKVTTISYLKGMREYSVVSDDGKVVMSAKAALATLFSSEVKLIRNAAYVTVTGGEEKNGSYKMTSTAYPFDVYGAASEGSLVAGASTILGEISEIRFNNDATDSSGKYYLPTKNENYGCFMIVKAAYNDKDYFYRLDFQIQDKENEDKVTILDLEPNHWYQVMVKEVTGPGYATPEEASKNPTPYIEYEIHDHAPVIYNMISDGMRELGVSHEIVYSNGVSDENDASTMRTLYIKLYSGVNSSEEKSFNIHNLSWDAEWLKIEDPEEVTQSDEYPIEGGDAITIGGNSTELDPNAKGTIYKCNVKFNKTTELGSLEDEITVTWKGLTRKVPVRWVREFTGTDLCKVTLKMFDADGGTSQFETEEYWKFLAGDKVNNSSVQLFGTGVKANNGKIRNEGLHFPVMYGEPGKANEKRWYYTYEIKFTEASLISAEYDWTLSVEGNPVIKDYVKVGMGSAENAVDQSISGTHSAGEDLLVFVTRAGNACPGVDGTDGTKDNDYTYGTGELVLTITPKESRTDSRLANRYSIDLYHTGFFHKSYEKHRVDEKDDVNYYYYEVVPIMGATRMRYWLDRNLGAKSAELYIQASDGTTYYGNSEAAGGYYQVASYEAYEDPKMYDDIAEEIYNIEERVSPPGYRVPKQKVWNALRNSPNFDTNSVGSYYNACYHTTIPGVDVFFPKARHMENGGMNGESRSGYYWTQTAASGTEKQEIGRWLKALCISGNSSSYVNGNVQTYAMSVRCINDISDDAQANRTYFNVSGATHVYLYTEDGSGNRTAVTNWPGQAIGDYQTMTNGWFNFSYESDNIDASQFYVIFNFVDKKGIIHTLSKSGDNPQNAEGWKVEGDSSNELIDSKELSIQGVPTKLGYWWQCNHETGSVYCYSDKPTPYKDPNSYRIYWRRYESGKTDNDFKYFTLIGANGNIDYSGTLEMINDTEYYYHDIKEEITDHIQFVLRPYSGSNWDAQTCDITVRPEDFSSDKVCTIVYNGWKNESGKNKLDYYLKSGIPD